MPSSARDREGVKNRITSRRSRMFFISKKFEANIQNSGGVHLLHPIEMKVFQRKMPSF